MGEWYNLLDTLPHPLHEVYMKKNIIFLGMVALALVLTAPALAASLGISPSHIELEVPGDGSATADLQVHYFSGDVQVSLVDIPLRVEPEVLHVDALDEPVDVQVTIYGDESLGSRVYNGYIRFLGLSGETVAVAVRIKAEITNIVQGQPLPEPVPEETPILEAAPEVIPEELSSPPAPQEPQATEPTGGVEDLSLNMVILIAGGLVFLGLIVLAISLAVRRRRY
jgi:hypothetical protein